MHRRRALASSRWSAPALLLPAHLILLTVRAARRCACRSCGDRAASAWCHFLALGHLHPFSGGRWCPSALQWRCSDPGTAGWGRREGWVWQRRKALASREQAQHIQSRPLTRRGWQHVCRTRERTRACADHSEPDDLDMQVSFAGSRLTLAVQPRCPPPVTCSMHRLN